MKLHTQHLLLILAGIHGHCDELMKTSDWLHSSSDRPIYSNIFVPVGPGNEHEYLSFVSIDL